MFTFEQLKNVITNVKPEQSYNDYVGEPYSKDGLLDGIINYTSFTTHAKLNNALGGSLKTPGIKLDPSLFKRNPNGWNIFNACNWIHNHASANSQHMCAKYVRQAIEAGGISTDGRPTWAWKYINYLPTIGFKHIDTINREQASSFRPEPGDIAVYQKGNDPNVPGHICMWTGAEWASDFKQKNMIVYRNTQSAYIFRFES